MYRGNLGLVGLFGLVTCRDSHDLFSNIHSITQKKLLHLLLFFFYFFVAYFYQCFVMHLHSQKVAVMHLEALWRPAVNNKNKTGFLPQEEHLYHLRVERGAWSLRMIQIVPTEYTIAPETPTPSLWIQEDIMKKPVTCFKNLKLNSHSVSDRVPDTFLTQESKHCKRKKAEISTMKGKLGAFPLCKHS